MQRARDTRRRGARRADLAKSDALLGKPPVISGRYRLIPLQGDVLAKSDALVVELGLISSG